MLEVFESISFKIPGREKPNDKHYQNSSNPPKSLTHVPLSHASPPYPPAPTLLHALHLKIKFSLLLVSCVLPSSPCCR